MKSVYTFFVMLIVCNCWLNVANAQTVRVPDANLAAILRHELGLAPNAPITRQAMHSLTVLDAQAHRIKGITGQSGQISNLTGLEHATGLTTLWLNNNNQISDIEPLARLAQLQELSITSTQISDIRPLTRLTQLRILQIGYNPISNFQPLAGLTQLRELSISVRLVGDLRRSVDLTQLESLGIWGDGSHISDLHLLSSLTQLRQLEIGDVPIRDLRFLEGLTQLEGLSLWYNGIRDVKPLAGLTQLTWLALWSNQVRDVSPLAGLTNLETLYLEGNPIHDASPLANLPNLRETDIDIPEPPPIQIPDSNLAAAVRKALSLDRTAPITQSAMRRLTRLEARESGITNLSGLESATQLTWLSLNTNQIRNIIPLSGLTRLKRLDLEKNQIRNITPLTGLTQLEGLYIGGTQINNRDVLRLTHLPNLKWLSLWGNKIGNIKPLANLTKLEGLWLGNNKIRDVSPLAGLVNLEVLELSGNPIKDFSPLANLPKLRDVDVEILPSYAEAGTGPLQTIFHGHTKAVWSVAFSPDGQTLASGSWDKTIRLWNLRTRRLETTLRGHTANIHSVVFSPDGQTLVSGSWDGTIRLWNPRNGEHKRTLTGHAGGVGSVAFSPDGQTLASGGVDRTIRLWDTNTYQVKRTLKGHTDVVDVVAFSPDGKTLASGSRDKTIRLWNPQNGKQKRRLTGHVKSVDVIAFSLDGKTLASTSWDNSVRLWNPQNGKQKKDLGYQSGWKNPVAFSSDSATLFIGNRGISVWDIQTSQYKTPLVENIGDAVSLVLSPDGSLLASGSGDNKVRLWNVQTRSEPQVLIVESQRPPMYWVDSETRSLSRLVGQDVEISFISSAKHVTGLAVDATNHKIYWTEGQIDETGEIKPGHIKSANLDGSDVQTVLTFDNALPFSIAIDTKRSKLYWSLGDTRGIRIMRATLNGKQIRNIVGNKMPTKLFVDVVGAKLYWVDRGTHIYRANLNGKNVQKVVGNTRTIGSIAVFQNKLYWTEGIPLVDSNHNTIALGDGAIKRANLNGKNVKTLVDFKEDTPVELAIDPVGQQIYFVTPPRWDINRVALNGKNRQNVVSGLSRAAFYDPITGATSLALGSTSGPVAAAPANGDVFSPPETTQLLANYPNPFNPETWIPYQLSASSDVKITIYDARGAVVRRLELGHQPAGTYTGRTHAAYWDGRNALGEPVASGVYFYTLKAGEFTATRKMLIRK